MMARHIALINRILGVKRRKGGEAKNRLAQVAQNKISKKEEDSF
jgi:hypothetical protein